MLTIMNKIRSKLAWKILAIYICVIFIPSLVIGVNYYSTVKEYILNEEKDLVKRTLDQYCSDIDAALESAENVYNHIWQNKNLVRFLSGEYSSHASQVSIYVSELRAMLEYSLIWSRFIEDVTVYMTNDSLLEMGEHFRKLEKLEGHAGLEAEVAKGHWRYDFERGQVVYYRAIKNISTKKFLGILEIKYNDDIIRESLSKLISDDRNITLIYQNNVYSLEEQSAELIGTEIEVVSQVRRIPIQVMMRTNTSSIRSSMIYSLWKTFLCFILLSLILFFVLYQLSDRITKFSQQIAKNMDDYPKLHEDNKYDELSMLIRNYNGMVKNNNYLLNQVKIEKLHQQEMEYKALQSQIDPHFIYNSLEGIRMMAELRDEPDISDVIFSLSKLMRYAFSISEKEVSIAQELDYVKQYINLQRMRVGNKIELQVTCNEEIGQVKCPRFSIQPMVENAVKYGFGKGIDRVIIWIEAELINYTAHIRISNSGQKIPEQKLHDINRLLNIGGTLKEYSSGSGIGLENINNRMRYLHRQTFSMALNNTEQGATVDLYWDPRDYAEVSKEEGVK